MFTRSSSLYFILQVRNWVTTYPKLTTCSYKQTKMFSGLTRIVVWQWGIEHAYHQRWLGRARTGPPPWRAGARRGARGARGAGSPATVRRWRPSRSWRPRPPTRTPRCPHCQHRSAHWTANTYNCSTTNFTFNTWRKVTINGPTLSLGKLKFITNCNFQRNCEQFKSAWMIDLNNSNNTRYKSTRVDLQIS